MSNSYLEQILWNQQFWNKICCHMFHVQNIGKNCTTWPFMMSTLFDNGLVVVHIRTFTIFKDLTATLETFIPVVNLGFTQTRLSKSNVQDFQNVAARYSFLLAKSNNYIFQPYHTKTQVYFWRIDKRHITLKDNCTYIAC